MSDHGLTPSDPSQTVTQDDVDRAVATVRRLAGWHVWPVREETITVDTPGDPLIILPTLRVEDVIDVTVEGQQVDMDTVSWSADGMITLQRAPRGLRRVAVTLRHGFESAPDLAGVCLKMADRSVQVQGSVSVGGISVGATAGITPQSTEWRVLDMYKLGPEP